MFALVARDGAHVEIAFLRAEGHRGHAFEHRPAQIVAPCFPCARREGLAPPPRERVKLRARPADQTHGQHVAQVDRRCDGPERKLGGGVRPRSGNGIGAGCGNQEHYD